MTFINLSEELNKRTAVMEEKLRNSFKAIKADNDEMKRRIEEISVSLKNSTLSNDLIELNKKVESNDSSFKKFKKDMARDSLKKEVVKEVMPLFNEKIDVGLKLVKLENKELKEELNSFKNKWSNANEAKINAGLAEMRANFAKLDKKAISEMRTLKSSTKKAISDQNSLIADYSAKIETYSGELIDDYRRSKKEIMSSNQKNFDSLKEEHDTEVKKLKGQMAYLKGRVNKELGAEEVVKEVKKVDVKKVASAPKPGFFSKFSKMVSANKESKKPEVKQVSVVSKKDKTLFSNLVSLLADESPEIKVGFTPAKKTASKKAEVSKKPVAHAGVKPAGSKKLEKQEDSGFFNSIIKSMSD